MKLYEKLAQQYVASKLYSPSEKYHLAFSVERAFIEGFLTAKKLMAEIGEYDNAHLLKEIETLRNELLTYRKDP